MIAGLLLLTAGAAFYFGIRCFTTENSIRKARRELEEITAQVDENRIIKLASPNRELEALLTVMNRVLEKGREERISYEKREKEFRRQIENISHDLRTPLTAIQGCLRMLDEENLSNENREALEVINRRAENLQYLIHQFYEYSILTTEDYQAEIRQIEVGRMCREMLLGSYQKFEERGIDVRVEIPEKPVGVLADEHALERILGNLLQNAVRYAKSRLEWKLSETEEKAELLCGNDTDSLSPEDIRQIFDRFYMAEPARNQGGTGLGLTISRHLAERMGAVMTAEPRQGGVIFRVTFFKKSRDAEKGEENEESRNKTEFFRLPPRGRRED